MIRNTIISLLFIVSVIAENAGTALAQSKKADLLQWVNPLIGTQGTGHTFPGPSHPFGLVQPGPDNAGSGWAYTSGYQFTDSTLFGFSQTRLSGTGIPELGDVLLLPFVQGQEKVATTMSKSTEVVKVGYYSIKKGDGVQCALSCTPRVAIHRYRFPNGQPLLKIDLNHGLKFLADSLVVEAAYTLEGRQRITGWAKTRNWVSRYYAFSIDLSAPWNQLDSSIRRSTDRAGAFLLSFGQLPKQELLVKVALSTTGIEGAKLNMMAELPDWNFDQVVINCRKSWSVYLNRVQMDAPTVDKIKFYTAFYHLLLQPANIADVGGQYRGADNQVRRSPDSSYYSTLSIWDVYRTAFPLFQDLVPERIPGIVRSMLDHHEDAGFLPIWTVWGQDNYCMIGNHAIPMLVSAWKNGFCKKEGARILRAIKETTSRSHPHSDWELYLKYGYYPFDLVPNESVSRTLETCYDDAAVMLFAKWLGDTATSSEYLHRSGLYQNLYDAETRQFRGKNQFGEWRKPFDPFRATSPLNNPGDYTEANAWQYFWTPAQHDFPGLVKLLGGNKPTEAKLDSFFGLTMATSNAYLGQEALIGQYAHGNEPGHHVPWLYAMLGKPEKSRTLIRKIVTEFYGTGPDGLQGNDDCGQMSAWLMAAYLGRYPLNPASGEWIPLQIFPYKLESRGNSSN